MTKEVAVVAVTVLDHLQALPLHLTRTMTHQKRNGLETVKGAALELQNEKVDLAAPVRVESEVEIEVETEVDPKRNRPNDRNDQDHLKKTEKYQQKT